ncbi:MAG TPA: ATP-binding cassette domain-containing protein, partial [Puia sp.]|nr:ATP-binding cassette domain-containing protein [Puia sp.]
MNISIKVENLHKDMGPSHAIQGVSLSLEPGLLHGLIGPEGSGKTTLLRHLIGLLKADQGKVTYFQDGKAVPLEEVR